MPRRPSLVGSPNTLQGIRRASIATPSRRNTSSMVPTSARSSYVRRKRARQLRLLGRFLPGYVNSSPFPPVKGYKLVYEQDGYLSVGTSGVLGTQQKFILNGLYDVDISGMGHQPYGFDALQVAYQRYKVHGVLIDLTFYNVQSINAIDVSYQINNPQAYSNSITGANPQAVGERQNAETVTLQNTGSQTKKVKFYLPMHKAFEMSRLQYKADIENTTADVGGNPASGCGLLLAVADPNGNSSGGCRYHIKLTYFVTMYQRQVMSQS